MSRTGRPPVAPALRFWPKVKAVPSGCWEWMATLDRAGYGRFWLKGTRQVFAHRFAYELVKGKIPEGLQIDHLCREHKCVNPDHLEAVTSRVNLLRGIGIPAREAQQTACIHGHSFTPENTYLDRQGHRSCNICRRRHSRKQWWSKRRKELGIAHTLSRTNI